MCAVSSTNSFNHTYIHTRAHPCAEQHQLTSDEYIASKVAAISAKQQHANNNNDGGTTTTALTVCRDYQSGKCVRPYCRFVHVQKGTIRQEAALF